MPENQYYIEKCKELIEKKLAWGNSASWQSQDFQNLSNLIFEETNVLLSASTLKRIWGKIQYNGTPNLSTLDSLANFANFSTWRAFTNSFAEVDEITTPIVRKKYKFNPLTLIFLIVASSLLVSFIFLKEQAKKLRYSDITFSSRAITSSVPNTVIFNYDATKSNADSVFIQQSWDSKRRFKVDKNRHEYTSTYYMPGYYRAKLILNDSIVSEHDIFIESKGWMGMLCKEPIPVYLPEKTVKHNNRLGITENDLNNNLPNNQTQVPVFVLTNVSKNWDVYSKEFSLDLELQNTYSKSNNPCKQTSVMLLGTEGVIIIPLSSPGCVGELKLRLGDNLLEGMTNDLSAFGVDFEKSANLKCVAKLNSIRIDLNGNKVYDGPFNKGIGKIIGARISFQGSGYIKSFRLNNI